MIHIVENTLRDGSYVIDFQFTERQTEEITNGLASLGFEFIEVGHGLGLGAWNNLKTGHSRENDLTYIQAAKRGAPDAKIGVFFIPGIGTEKDIALAVDSGINFIRIGSNVDTFQQTRPFVEYAKKQGILVAVNLMKSYGVKSYEFTQIAREIDSWELADAIYLVDSAGCMMPDEVYEYIDRTRQRVKTRLGFHGHNNLSLAIANTIQAVKAGATYVDTCVRGMGRSAGNAQTEIMVYLLDKLAIRPLPKSIYDFYDFANNYIVPIMKDKQGFSDEEIHIGLSRFHTSYMPLANEIASLHGVNLKKLMKQVSDINCLNPERELFNQVAESLKI